MSDEISIDPEIVRDNIRRLAELSDRTATVITGLQNEAPQSVPSVVKTFDDALNGIVNQTLAAAKALELQIREYSRDLGKTAQDASAVDQHVADLLNKVERSAFDVTASSTSPGTGSAPSSSTPTAAPSPAHASISSNDDR